MEIIKGGVTAANGFKAAGAYAGFKKIKDDNKEEINDMAMVVSDSICSVAGTFTTNVVKAAPVKWDMDVVYNNKEARAVVVNSGIANAATGEQGMKACLDTATKVASELGIDKNEVLIGSTGVIGYEIPMEKINRGVDLLKEKLSDTTQAGTIASKAIMTTDTVNKEVAVTTIIDEKTVTIGGMCKGSGMIHPNMCTMLCYITTDVNITSEMLQKALSSVVPDTFNMVSVDGDTSTNDTVLVLANGEAGNKKIETEDEDYNAFAEALLYVCTEFSKKMAGDGEGATALFEVKVTGAKTKEDAKVLAKSVVSSSLVKAMIYGHDANSGRIMCALGYSGIDFDPEKVDLYFESKVGKIQIAKDGKVLSIDEDFATKILSEEAVTAICDMKMGNQSATAWGCDLTYDYVKINGDYRS